VYVPDSHWLLEEVRDLSPPTSPKTARICMSGESASSKRASIESLYHTAGEDLDDEEFKREMRTGIIGRQNSRHDTSEFVQPKAESPKVVRQRSASLSDRGIDTDMRRSDLTSPIQPPSKSSPAAPDLRKANTLHSFSSSVHVQDTSRQDRPTVRSMRTVDTTSDFTSADTTHYGFAQGGTGPCYGSSENPAAHIIEEETDAKKLHTFQAISGEGGTRILFQCWRNFVSRMRRKVHFAPKSTYGKDNSNWGQLKYIPCHTKANEDDEDFNGLGKDSRPHELSGSAATAARHRGMILSPGSTVRLSWDIAGAFLLFFDCVMIPLSVFEPLVHPFFEVMDWVTLLFWTFDMAASCLTGYHDKGITIMDPKLIFLHYLRTWFLLDLFVVVPDWTFTIVEMLTDIDAGKGGNSSRFLRALRVIRISRMLRLVKLRRILQMLRDRIDSEHLFIMATVFKLLFNMLVVNHFLAAMWYGIGDVGRDFDAPNWIDQHDFSHTSLSTRYFVSFHWSLTQISPASMDVQPHNVAERIYAIFVLIFGLVLFSSFVSSITTSMTQLRTMEGDKSKQMWLLRRYLRNNGIQNALAWRILRYVEYACNENKNQVSEQKLWVLKLLSNQLRNELNFAVSFSCVRNHPFFEVMSRVSRQTVVLLANNAMNVQSLAFNDRVTVPGVLATNMYMVQFGKLSYAHFSETHLDVSKREMSFLCHQDWACEGALWTEWYTLGEVVAETECKIINIQAAPFTEVIKDELMVWKIAAIYARNFVNWLSNQPYGHLTDVFKAAEMEQLAESFVGHVHFDRHTTYESLASTLSRKSTRRPSTLGTRTLGMSMRRATTVIKSSRVSKMSKTSKLSKVVPSMKRCASSVT